MVAGKAIDPKAEYTLASHNYMLLNGGDGYTMFKGCEVLQENVMLDNQVLINYMVETLAEMFPRTASTQIPTAKAESE